MASDDVFRFMTVRAVQRTTLSNFRGILVPNTIDEPNTINKPVLRNKSTYDMPLSREDARKWAEVFLKSPEFVDVLSNLETPIAELDQWLLTHNDREEPSVVVKKIQSLAKVPLDELVTGNFYQNDRRNVLYSLAALAILPQGRERLRSQLLRAMLNFGLIEQLTWQPSTLEPPEKEHYLLVNGVVVLPTFFPIPAEALSRPPAIIASILVATSLWHLARITLALSRFF